MPAARIYAIGGGKGGVGKSLFAIALGTGLADAGRRVALVDLDLGAANLHTYLGITYKTRSIAEFILRKASSLDELLIDTRVPDMQLISGADFVPGMANPQHWMKLKMLRHIRQLPVDAVVLDLGAGVHFNTLDFFGLAHQGLIITAPEPGAVMNAYGFIKSALFRRVWGVFKKHPELGPKIEKAMQNTGEEQDIGLDWLSRELGVHAPELLDLFDEIEASFRPGLVVNRLPEGEHHTLVDNLIALCRDKLDLELQSLSNLPEVPAIRDHLLNFPAFLAAPAGESYREAVARVITAIAPDTAAGEQKREFSDEDIASLIALLDLLDESQLAGTNREAWKLRSYFKPAEVVSFLQSQGVKHQVFVT